MPDAGRQQDGMRDWQLLGQQLNCNPAHSQGPLARRYRAERELADALAAAEGRERTLREALGWWLERDRDAFGRGDEFRALADEERA